MSIRAIKAIIRKGDKILLIKKSDKVDIYPGRWDLPGGRLDLGETWNQGLTREVREETGLKIKLIREVRDWENKKWDTIGKTVLCEYVTGEVRLSWEHTEYRWMVPDDVFKGDFPEWIQKDVKAIDSKINE
jgi:8-oxo-dGTP diphosphatase